MLFNSHEFILAFLPATLLIFFATSKYSHAAARLFLLVASFAFYAWWSLEYGLLIVATIVANYAFGRTIQRWSAAASAMAKPLLALAVSINLALLGYFKYRNFFVQNLNDLTGADWPMAAIVLPLAISFHTFQQIAYLVDSWRRKVDQPSLPTYALFVLFFPQLIAGPIVHHWQLLPQLASPRFHRFDAAAFAAGVSFFVLGLAKKVLLANPLAALADPVFGGALAEPPAMTQAWVAVLAYTLGLYFDFSGYSDMAIGLARMFGIRLPYNFDSPYQATSIIDFWRRWHITLSNWLRDYLYVPLGGNRHGRLRRYLNLMVTMLLGGLWHGAAWTFVFWGFLHGFYLSLNHAWRGLDRHGLRLPPAAGWALTFLAVCFAWVFFRSPSFAHALAMVEGLAGFNGLHTPDLFTIFGPGKALILEVALVIALLLPNSQAVIDGTTKTADAAVASEAGAAHRRLRWQPTPLWASGLALLLLVSITQMSERREFVYFQF